LFGERPAKGIEKAFHSVAGKIKKPRKKVKKKILSPPSKLQKWLLF
jgi:hypothetical protein